MYTNNQIQHLAAVSDYRYRLNNLPEQWHNKSVNYKRYNKAGELIRWSTPYVNVLWFYIGREFTEKLGPEIKVYKHLCLFTGRELDEKDKLELPAIYIHTSISNISTCAKLEFTIRGLRGFTEVNYFGTETQVSEKRFSLVPPGNMELTPDNIVRFIFDYVHSTVFYPDGYYKDLQMYYCLTKDTLKNYLKDNRIKEYNAILEREIYDWIARRFNLGVSTWPIDKAVELVNKLGKQPKYTPVYKFDSSFMWNFDGDINEAEALFYEEYETQGGRGAILV